MRMIAMTSTKPGLIANYFRLLLFMAITAWVGCSPALPGVEVPELLLSRFKAIYPKAEDVAWEKGDGVYKVTFHYNESKLAIDFLPDGAVERTRMYIDEASLPATTLTFLSTTVPGQKINHATKNVDGFGAVTWEVSVGADTYLFSTKGDLMGLLPRKPAAK